MGLQQEVVSLFQDRDDTVWVGTYGGLFRLDFRRYAFETLYEPSGAQFEGQVSSLAEHDGVLWVGTFGAGIYGFDLERKVRVQSVDVLERSSGTCSNYVWGLAFQENVGVIFAGSKNVCVLRSDGSIDRLGRGSYARSVQKDDAGRLWMASLGGSALFNSACSGAGRSVAWLRLGGNRRVGGVIQGKIVHK